MKVTENFDSTEFDCTDGTKYPEKWIQERLLPLCLALEKIRLATGKPLKITSGYRTERYNKRIGGAKFSYHCLGMAADITCAGYTGPQLHAVIDTMIRSGEIHDGGLGKYPGRKFTHYDIGPSRRWKG